MKEKIYSLSVANKELVDERSHLLTKYNSKQNKMDQYKEHAI